MTRPLKVYFDGGCRPNPGTMEIAVVAAGRAYVRRDLGPGTSAEAEWLALIHALRIARSLGAPDFVLLGDALSVVGPAGDAARARGPAVAHLEAFRALWGGDSPPRVRHVRRTQNLAGIALAALHPR